jgi:sigma-54 specific flagellar transcriptional regulator A
MGEREDESIITAEFSRNGAANQSKAGKEIGAEELRHAYRLAEGNITKASEMLGIHKATFYRYLKNLNLNRQDLEENRV